MFELQSGSRAATYTVGTHIGALPFIAKIGPQSLFELVHSDCGSVVKVVGSGRSGVTFGRGFFDPLVFSSRIDLSR